MRRVRGVLVSMFSGVLISPLLSQTFTVPPGASLDANVLNREANATLFTGTDIGAKVNSAIAAVGCGAVIIPAGTYNFATTIVKPRCIDLEGQGADATLLNWTPASGVALAVGDSVGPNQNGGGGISNLSLGSTTSSSTAVGLWLGGDQAGTVLPAIDQAEGQTFANLRVASAFGTGVEFANHSYKNLFVNFKVYGSLSAGMARQVGSIDNYEVNSFVGGAIFNNTQYAINGCPDCEFQGTSFDYNWSGGAVGGSPDITGDTITCNQCHFEKNNGPFSDSGINCGQCVFQLSAAGTTIEPYLLSGTGDRELNVSDSNVFSAHPVTTFATFDGTSGSTGQLVLQNLAGNGNGSIASTYTFGAVPPWSYNIDDGLLHTNTIAVRSQSYASLNVSLNGNGYEIGGAKVISYASGGALSINGLFGLVRVTPGSNTAFWTDAGLNASAMSAAFSSYHENLTTPASSSAVCSAGDFTDDANYHYVCVGTNTWKRVALSSF